MDPEVVVEDDFSAAFDKLSSLGTPDPAVQPSGEAKPAEPVTEPPAPVATPSEPPAPAVETPPAIEEPPPAAAAPAEPATPATPSDDELLKRLAGLISKPAAESEPAPAPAASEPLPELYTPEEQTFLKEYEKEWPDVAKAEALRRRSEYRDLVGYVFGEIAKELGPLAQNLTALMQRTHLEDVYNQVDDYDTVRDKVVQWVDSQPSYLQTAYKQVIQQGTPDEIADLVARYKKENAGEATTPVTPPATPSKKVTELPTATKQAVESLAPVSSKRSVIVEAEDSNDFEGAFERFAKAAKA